MQHQKINAALAERLQTLTYSTEFLNAPALNAAGLYLVEAYMPNRTSEVGMADNSSNDYMGLYQVTVKVARDTYKKDALTVADEVGQLFKRGTVLAYGSISVRVQRVSMGEPAYEGDKFVVPVTVEWRCFAKNE